jgi:hypothetical protein
VLLHRTPLFLPPSLGLALQLFSKADLPVFSQDLLAVFNGEVGDAPLLVLFVQSNCSLTESSFKVCFGRRSRVCPREFEPSATQKVFARQRL